MKKDYKLINILNPIGNFHTFSKYSNALEKIFKKKSLKNLLYSLNNPTKYNEDYIDEKLLKKEIERTSKIKKDNEKNLLEYNYEDYLQSMKERIKKNKKIEPWSIDAKRPRIPLIKKKLDFYKYNPNYNSIYKNVPSFSYVKSSKKTNKLKNILNTDSSKIIPKNKSNLFLKTATNETTNSSRNLGDKFFPLITSISCNTSKKMLINDNKQETNLCDKNNHSFRFSKYSPRKTIELKLNDKITYLKDFDYLIHMNKTIDFKKMPKRNEDNLINTYTLKNPSMCYYNPKYDCIDKKTKKISFNPESFKNTLKYKKNKKLKRILMSYEVNKEYLSIDNSKLVTAESISKLINLK